MPAETILWQDTDQVLPTYNGKILVSTYERALDFSVVDVAYFQNGDFYFDPGCKAIMPRRPNSWADLPHGSGRGQLPPD